MTFQQILLAYFDNLPMGSLTHFDRETSLDEAHDEVLTHLMTTQHSLECFREELMNRIAALPDEPNKPAKQVQLGTITGTVMVILDALRKEINTFIEQNDKT